MELTSWGKEQRRRGGGGKKWQFIRKVRGDVRTRSAVPDQLSRLGAADQPISEVEGQRTSTAVREGVRWVG
jgi:hypothetical protein